MNNNELDFTNAEMLRKIAEEKLKEKKKGKQKENVEPSTEFDVKKLLHELQVHQIELEMQNEELKEAYETAETALRKYTMLYDFSPMGYFILDSGGSINELNFTGAEILGEKRFSLENSNFKLFVSEESKQKFTQFLSKVFTSNSKEFCQIKLGYDNHPLCNVYMEGVVTDDNQQCLLSVVDISSFTKTDNP